MYVGKCPRGERTNANACLRVISRLWARRDGGGESVDQAETSGCAGMLAQIAGTVPYLHMHLSVELHGQPGWVTAGPDPAGAA